MDLAQWGGAPLETQQGPSLFDELERHAAECVSTAATSASVRLYGGAGILVGWGFLETTGTNAATIELYDGMDATAQLIVPIAMSQGQSVRDWLGRPGLALREGAFLNVLAGTVRGSLWIVKRRRT